MKNLSIGIFYFLGILSFIIMGCGVQVPTSHSSLSTDLASSETKPIHFNLSCQSIQATMPAGVYNKGIYHDENTSAILNTLPNDITKNITQSDNNASYSKYAVIVYRLGNSPYCKNRLMIPVLSHTTTSILGFLNPGNIKVSFVKDVKIVNATENIRGFGKFIYTKYEGNTIFSRNIKIVSNKIYRLALK